MNRLLLFALLLGSPLFADEPQPTLIGGRPAPVDEFPASVWTRSCTATVVADRVVFIAAHCVSNGGKISFAVGATQYSATCSQSRDYRRNNTSDYALCETNIPVTGVKFEKLNTDPNRFKVGDTVLLSGYGCIRAGGGGGNDGIYRIGEATVARLPSGTSNDIVTNNGAALCFGDSGGPAFHIDDKGDRVLISTNSRGDIKTTSYLSSVATTNATSFFTEWVQTKKYKICGLDKDATGCRGSDSSPDPDKPLSEFAIDRPWVKVTAKLSPGYESFMLVLSQTIGDLIDGFGN